MKMLSALKAVFARFTPGKKPAVPKYKLVADPTNKRGRFDRGGGTKPLRLVHPPVKPNCRADLVDRVLRPGGGAFVYPGVRPDWR